MTFGEYVKNKNPLYEAGKDETEDLAANTGEYAHLMAEEFGWGSHLYKAQGENAVGEPYHNRNFQKRDYLHYSLTGKSILSCLPDEQVLSIVDEYG